MDLFIEHQGIRIFLDDQVYNPKEDSFFMLDTINNELLDPSSLIIEIGPGTGYIILSITRQNPINTTYAIDINFEAAKLTKYNALINELEDLQVICGYLTTPFRRIGVPSILIFNPPYLPKDPEIDGLMLKSDHYQLIGGEKGYETASELINNLDGLNAIVYLIISSVAITPHKFSQIHHQWNVQVLNSLKMGFETIWVIKLNKKENE